MRIAGTPLLPLLASVLLSTSTLAAQDSDAACTALRSARIDALSVIGIEASGFPAELAHVPFEAARLWNEAACNASGRPRFVIGAGERTLTVIYVAGTPTRTGGACATFTRDEIRLYAFTRDPLRHELVRCGDGPRLAEIVAHELGHALGLADQYDATCQDRIMSQLARRSDGSVGSRAIHHEECRAVEGRFFTLAERLEAETATVRVARLSPPATSWALP